MNIDYIEVLWADQWYLVPAILKDNLRKHGLVTREQQQGTASR